MINYTLIGITCSVVGNFLISLSLNIQKYAHTKLQQRPHQPLPAATLDENSTLLLPPASIDKPFTSSPNYLSSPYWWLGAVIMTIGECGNFVAYGFAPVSIVSPLGIVTIISNCTIAPLLFHEPLRIRDLLGTGFASIGVLLVIVSSINKEDTPVAPPPGETNKLIYKLLTSKTYLYYVIITMSLAVVLIFYLFSLKNKLKQHPTHNSKNIYTFGNILLVAIFGAHTAMATKCLSTLIEFSSSSAGIWKLFTQFQTYYLIFVLIFTAVCQIKYLNNSLKIESSTKVIPVHFVFFTISVLVGSLIVFQDEANKQAWQVLTFLIGCVFTFVSVFLIAGGDKPENSNDSVDEESSSESFVTGFSNLNNEGGTHFYTAVNSPEPNNNIKNTHNQYWEFQFKVPSLKSPPSALTNKQSQQSIMSNILPDSLLEQDLNSRSSESFLSRSTSIQNNTQPPSRPIEYLAIPKNPNHNKNNHADNQSSRSLPDRNPSANAYNKRRRHLNRSRSFNRIVEFNSSKSELVGIPGSGSVLLSHLVNSTLNIANHLVTEQGHSHKVIEDD